MGDRAVVVKLGGSIVTDKKAEFSYRGDAVASLGRELASSGESAVLVHGGGSFGHPVAKKFGLSSSHAQPSSEGVAETRRAMFELDARICDSLLKAGVAPYAFSPYPLLTAAGSRARPWLAGLMRTGLTPVTFGDVIQGKGGFRIISGDTIALQLSKTIGAQRCVFVMDVDGILDSNGEVIPALSASEASRFRGPSSADVTGGIAAKVRAAGKIARGGTEVAFLSGFRPAEFSKALKRLGFHGTIVRVPSRD